MRDLGNANRANGTSDGFDLRDQDIDPLRPSDQDDFFGFVTLLRPGCDPPRCLKTTSKWTNSMGVDQGAPRLGAFPSSECQITSLAFAGVKKLLAGVNHEE
jgi:hypothetical protein